METFSYVHEGARRFHSNRRIVSIDFQFWKRWLPFVVMAVTLPWQLAEEKGSYYGNGYDPVFL